MINGATGGFTAFSHPTNFRHPQGLRIHPSNPYWAFTPVISGKYTLEPGAPFASKYRVVSFDGAADAAFLNRIYADYATPPTVVLTN